MALGLPAIRDGRRRWWSASLSQRCLSASSLISWLAFCRSLLGLLVQGTDHSNLVVRALLADSHLLALANQRFTVAEVVAEPVSASANRALVGRMEQCRQDAITRVGEG